MAFIHRRGHQRAWQYLPMARLFCRDQHHGAEGKLQPRQWDDVIGGIRTCGSCPDLCRVAAPDHFPHWDPRHRRRDILSSHPRTDTCDHPAA